MLSDAASTMQAPAPPYELTMNGEGGGNTASVGGEEKHIEKPFRECNE